MRKKWKYGIPAFAVLVLGMAVNVYIASRILDLWVDLSGAYMGDIV
jgi:hypothetical protein